MKHRARPAVLGGGLVAVCVAVAATVASLTGSPGDAVSARAGTGLAHAAPSPGESGPSAVASSGTVPSGSQPGTSQGSHAEPSTTQGSTAQPGTTQPSTVQPSTVQPGAGRSVGPASLEGATTRLIVPDVIASVPSGVSEADLARLRRLSGVRAVLAVDGARITVNGAPLAVLAAPAAALRPWTPPSTAADAAVWSGFEAGDLITTVAAARSAGLAAGSEYPVVAGVRTRLTVGAPALLPIAGVDAIVDQARGRALGLVRDIAVLVNAPAVSPQTLAAQVKAALGANATVIGLVPAKVSTSLPVDTTPPAGRPASYLQLFQESAARYCPGLSWTVLAAIGQIESADGQNMGPSSAGALGPMQFLPSTWRTWGIDGFGDTGTPDIMNPFDAVPSAARLLCADGAAGGGQQLSNAIFDYNHATWYVDEVLALAAEYARE